MSTFGVTAAVGSTSSSSATKVAVSQASPSTSGTVTGAGAFMGFSASMNTLFVIYSDSGGSPGALLATADVQAFSNASVGLVTWTFSGANKIFVTAGNTYWIGPGWQSGATATYDRDTPAGGRVEGTGWTWPSPTSPSWAAAQSGPMSAYVTYVEPAGDHGLRVTSTAVTRSYFY